MIYITFIDGTYTLKNKLERDFYAELKAVNRMLLDQAGFEALKICIELKVDQLNIENPKCNPLQVHWQSQNNAVNAEFKFDDYKLWIGTGRICNFYIYAVLDKEARP